MVPTSVNAKSVQTTNNAKGEAGLKTVWVGKPGEAMAQMQSMVDKLKSMQNQYQTNMQIEDVGHSMALTRQELDKASRDQLASAQGPEGDGKLSYWERLSVSSKARTINKLKDQLHELELERSRLLKDLSAQVASGSYSASGEEILKGMTEEA